MEKMNLTPLGVVVDEVWGPVGTPERGADAFSAISMAALPRRGQPEPSSLCMRLTTRDTVAVPTPY